MSKPLYQQLNEQRTQGEWEVSSFLTGDEYATNILVPVSCTNENEKRVCMRAELQTLYWDIEKSEANAQYTALAVNNLHHLAEALAGLIGFLETYPPYFEDGKSMATDIDLETAKQALSRIS